MSLLSALWATSLSLYLSWLVWSTLFYHSLSLSSHQNHARMTTIVWLVTATKQIKKKTKYRFIFLLCVLPPLAVLSDKLRHIEFPFLFLKSLIDSSFCSIYYFSIHSMWSIKNHRFDVDGKKAPPLNSSNVGFFSSHSNEFDMTSKWFCFFFVSIFVAHSLNRLPLID